MKTCGCLCRSIHKEQIVKDGNTLDPSHVLNKKSVPTFYPMDDRGNRIEALSDKTVQDIKRSVFSFTMKQHR